MEQIERIQAMEEKLNASLDAIGALEQALDAYRSVRGSIRALGDYLASEEWRLDLDADEKGLLPAGLRRGVLSEDSIYNMLEADAQLRQTLAGFGESAAAQKEKEYRLIEVRLDSAEAKMNEMAREGWEVAGTAIYLGGMTLKKETTPVMITFCRMACNG